MSRKRQKRKRQHDKILRHGRRWYSDGWEDIYGTSGEAMKAFNIKDGYGIHDILLPHHITPVIITGRQSKIVENRSKELGITEVHQGVKNKLQELQSITGELGSVAYIGDDINDLPVMDPVKAAGGLVGAPKDAVKAVLKIADFIADHNGGDGAVRDFIDWVVGGEQ